MFPATSVPNTDWWKALWPDPGAVIGRLDIPRTANVVDLCCGDGYFTVPLGKNAASVVAIDLDGKLLADAAAATEAGGARNCRFVQGDAMDIAVLVGQQAVDYVFIANTLHGVPDKATLAQRVGSVLKAGGLFIVLNWHAYPREETTVLGIPRGPKTEMRMTPKEVAAILSPQGFTQRTVIDLPPYHYASVFVKGEANVYAAST
jgi:ubiquinone/menaquinone biosynthesis C-methylase UbiE